jgi:signal transduction histidine kinase
MPSPRRILVVLADSADRALAALLLRQGLADCAVEEIGDALAFMEALVDGGLDVAVVGHPLPWVDALDLLASVRRHHPKVVSVLLDSGGGGDLAPRLPAAAVDRYLRRGSAGFLELPKAVHEGLQQVATRGLRTQADAVDRTLVEAAPVGLFSAGPDGTLTRANAAFVRILGQRRQGATVLGARLQDLFEGASPPIDWTGLLTGRAGAVERPVSLDTAGPVPLRVSLGAWPVPGQGGHVERLDGLVRELPAEVVEAASAPSPGPSAAVVPSAELEQLTFAVSHDLQEPLHVIAHHAKQLADRYGERLGAEGDRFLAQLAGSAERMQSMIDGLLECSRAGQSGAPLRPVDFGRALEEALANLRASIEESGAEVRHTLMPSLYADFHQVVQLFQNLIGNAIKFRGVSPPRVVVGARERESDWRFAVKDNGIGIDPRFHARIFGMFQRLHTEEEYPGTGVGLALCKRIVARHGGEIWVHSAPEEGSTFYFTIPKRPSPSAAEPQRE